MYVADWEESFNGQFFEFLEFEDNHGLSLPLQSTTSAGKFPQIVF